MACFFTLFHLTSPLGRKPLDAEAAKELSEFFKSVFVKESSEPVPKFNVDSVINTTRKSSWSWQTRATQNDEKNSSISKL